METVIVIGIVALAAIYLVKSFMRDNSKGNGCACGSKCASCPPASEGTGPCESLRIKAENNGTEE